MSGVRAFLAARRPATRAALVRGAVAGAAAAVVFGLVGASLGVEVIAPAAVVGAIAFGLPAALTGAVEGRLRGRPVAAAAVVLLGTLSVLPAVAAEWIYARGVAEHGVGGGLEVLLESVAPSGRDAQAVLGVVLGASLAHALGLAVVVRRRARDRTTVDLVGRSFAWVTGSGALILLLVLAALPFAGRPYRELPALALGLFAGFALGVPLAGVFLCPAWIALLAIAGRIEARLDAADAGVTGLAGLEGVAASDRESPGAARGPT